MNKSNISLSFNLIFTILCFVVTCIAVLKCFQTYLKNEDVCLVSFKRFNGNPDQIYPTSTICIINPVQQEKLEKFANGTYNISSYTMHLNGELNNEELQKISYDDVTVDLNDYLLSYKVIYPDKLVPYQEMRKKPYLQDGWKGPYVSFRKEEVKCFSFDIPFNHNTNVEGVVINLNSTIFRDRTRPNEWPLQIDIPGLSFSIHLRSQMILSYSTMARTWQERSINSSKDYTMEFDVNTMDIMSYRSKKDEPCVEDWRNYDQVLYKDLMNKIGCQAKYWKLNKTFPYCTKKDEFEQINQYFLSALQNNISQPPPCRTIKQSQYQYKDSEIRYHLQNNNHTDINIVINYLKLNHYFKEIMQVEAYSSESLLGIIIFTKNDYHFEEYPD